MPAFFSVKKGIIRDILYRVARRRAESSFHQISRFLKKGDTLLDVGCGTGNVCEILREKSFKVIPLDVKDLSIVRSVRPIIYKGKKFPFKDKSFDVVLLLTTLHHTKDPETILIESKRVADRIVIIEDVYSNTLQRYLIFFLDSLLNLEFQDHPHTNLDDDGWRRIFSNNGLRLVEVDMQRCYVFITQRVYHLKCRR
jgi:ubiquinone/menaquinone biosynthesis C-methylase UbiE